MFTDDIEFSSLRTVSSFDKGDGSTVAVDLNTDELQRFSPSSLLVESLIEQLCKLVEKDPNKRRKIYLTICQKLHQMNLIDESYEKEEFEFMRSHYQKALYHLLTIAKSAHETKSIYPKPSERLQASSHDIIQWSRYSTEFEESEYIAKGGFGHVYKVRHRLDGEMYAVKKIYVRYKSVNDFLQNLREVKMLAKLNHPNIVAYKAAWLEPMVKKKIRNLEKSVDKTSMKEDSLEVVFENSNSSPNTTSEEKSELLYEDRESLERTEEGLICHYRKVSFEYSRCWERRLVPESEWAVLYIQMQLCQQTLRQWLDLNNQTTQRINVDHGVEIFRQVVSGVEYIHSQGIVHHDIKPSNIFVSSDLREVQVGDFGLACSLLTHQPSPLSVLTTHQPGQQLGTKLYAAPEQLKGHCHPKSDVYSLGIILFELIQPFNTSMERSKVIGQLKSGQIPTELTAAYPHLAKVISETVCSLKRRPTSSELLAKLDESQNTSTSKILAEQNETISQLRRESLLKDEQIASLRQELQKLQSQKLHY